ncbi:MAG: tail fiber domain-containing protein [Burkholderiales bacterium]
MNEKVPAPKKPYAAPRLTSYGEVRHVVQAGTKGGMENMMMVGSMFMVSSDRAVKENLVRIGRHPLGIGLYLFDYRAEYRDAYGDGRQFGVMADEVAAVLPQAVSVNVRGHAVVDYAMLGLRKASG